MDLHPIKDSDQDLSLAAATLDHCRFFYRHLWFPWDTDDDESRDWPKEHLSNRITLLEVGGANVARMVRMAKEYSQLQNELDELALDGDEEGGEADPKNLALMMRIDARKNDIRREANVLENPVLRLALEERILEEIRESHPTGQRHCLVWPGDRSLRDLQEALAQVKGTRIKCRIRIPEIITQLFPGK